MLPEFFAEPLQQGKLFSLIKSQAGAKWGRVSPPSRLFHVLFFESLFKKIGSNTLTRYLLINLCVWRMKQRFGRRTGDSEGWIQDTELFTS